MGLLPLTLIRDRRHSFVELYSYDDRGASSYGTAGYLGNGYFLTVKHAVVALGQEGASDPRVIKSIELMIDGRPISARVVDAGDARVEVDPGDWAILEVRENIDLPALTCRAELSVRVCRSDLPSGQRLLQGHRRIDRVRGPADSQPAGHLFDGRPPRRVRRRCAERRGSARGHSHRPNAGRFPILVHSSASRRDVPEGEVRARDNRRSACSRTARHSRPSLNRFRAVRATAIESGVYAANMRARANADRGMVLATTHQESANDPGAGNLEGSTGCHAGSQSTL